MQSWSSFLDPSKFSRPSSDHRIASNLNFWIVNYLQIYLGLFVTSVVFGQQGPLFTAVCLGTVIVVLHATFRKRSLVNMAKFELWKRNRRESDEKINKN